MVYIENQIVTRVYLKNKVRSKRLYQLENILSVGKNIREWQGECIHLYYTRSSKALQVDYCTAGDNPIRMEKTVDADVLNVEISQTNGIYVNGENWNFLGNTDNLTNDMNIYSELWGLDEIEVGSQEGAHRSRSNATYNYILLQLIEPDGSSNISDINVDELNSKADIFTINGVKVNALQKGINIVRKNGKTMKVFKR